MQEELIELFEIRIDVFKERVFFNKLFKHRGVVYGGFLRDVIANVQPKDIDVVVSVLYSAELYGDLLNAGFTGVLNEDNDTMIWSLEGHLPIECYVVEDSPDETFIGPESAPDYDVNLLRYDGKSFRSWVDPSADITSIVEHIKTRLAVEFHEDEVRPERRAKIISKGYTIVAQ